MRAADSRLVCALWVLLVLAARVEAHEVVEVSLIASLDEPRGYCLDMIGYQERARTDRPLHAHTCYSYRGGIAVDQGVDRALVGSGRFRFVHFGFCMRVERMRTAEAVSLGQCADSADQIFRLTNTGEIHPSSAPGLCVTIGDGSGAEGGGGQPVHLRRPIRLEPCSEEAAARQRWRLR